MGVLPQTITKVFNFRRIIDKLCSLIETRGADVWWTCDVTELLTNDVIKDHQIDTKEVTKGKVIRNNVVHANFNFMITSTPFGFANF